MANITCNMTPLNNQTMQAVWLAVTENDTGLGALMAEWPDRTVQVVGDFTSSGAITMEGSNDGTNWGTLNDFEGDALVITSAAPRLIAENTAYIRPRATAGSSVAMDIYVIGHT